MVSHRYQYRYQYGSIDIGIIISQYRHWHGWYWYFYCSNGIVESVFYQWYQYESQPGIGINMIPLQVISYCYVSHINSSTGIGTDIRLDV